jgi:putative membrane protein
MNRTSTTLDSTEMAFDRTWLAHERTLMAWVRTATSMISFGFTIFKFFEFQIQRGVSEPPGILSPRTFAVIVVSIGLFSLLMATYFHRKETKELAARSGVRRSSHAEVIAVLISGFGVLTLLSTIIRA